MTKHVSQWTVSSILLLIKCKLSVQVTPLIRWRMEQLHNFCKSERGWVQTVLWNPNLRKRRKRRHDSARLVWTNNEVIVGTVLCKKQRFVQLDDEHFTVLKGFISNSTPIFPTVSSSCYHWTRWLAFDCLPLSHMWKEVSLTRVPQMPHEEPSWPPP